VTEMIQGEGGAKNSRRVRTPSTLLSVPMGTVLLQSGSVNITIECVGVTVQVQVQKVYQ